MTLRSVTVNVGHTNILCLASKVIGVPGASANRMIEAAIRAYRGENRADIIKRVSRHDSPALSGGGQKHARIDESLVTGIENISRAGRIGLAMLMYDMTIDEACEWETGLVRMGRPPKNGIDNVADPKVAKSRALAP